MIKTKFYIDVDIVEASGTQTFVTEAEGIFEAEQNFLSGNCDIKHSDVEVTELGI